MGAVYLAQAPDGELYAIKVMTSKVEENGSFLETVLAISMARGLNSAPYKWRKGATRRPKQPVPQ